MGTLGQYLREAREAREIDLRAAAQQTRISLHYLKALEEEDFARLPGEVFVKGFLKNYIKFLHLNETEVMKRYGELRPPKAAPSAVPASTDAEQPAAPGAPAQKAPERTALEPFVWAAAIMLALVLFLFTALPSRHSRQAPPEASLSPAGQIVPGLSPNKSEKLYLEVVALDNTWLLVRIDTSPQKKAVLKKGESLVWSADERFQLSYSGSGALKLALNGKELSVTEPKSGVIRDLTIIASGIVNRKVQPEFARPEGQKRKPTASPLVQQQAPAQQTAAQPQKPKPPEQQPTPEQPQKPDTPQAPPASPQGQPVAQEPPKTPAQ